jgi:hypothetical protein
MKPAVLPDLVYRIGRRPDPLAWPDWAFAGSDGTFGNRFDDPFGTYRVLYAATERHGAYVETLARFRPDPAVLAGLDEIDADTDEPAPPRGVVPNAWFAVRSIGSTRLSGTYVDLGAAETLGALRTALASRLVHYGLVDLDGAAIRLSAPRRFTQEISRAIYELTDADGDRVWDGVRYLSRLGDDLHNWAIFEPTEVSVVEVEAPNRHDPALATALAVLGLELEPIA